MLLAHQGGWDEILFVLAPVSVIVLLLALAKRRAEALQRARAEEAGAAVGDSDASGGTPGA
jgi:hypothetical protein